MNSARSRVENELERFILPCFMGGFIFFFKFSTRRDLDTRHIFLHHESVRFRFRLVERSSERRKQIFRILLGSQHDFSDFHLVACRRSPLAYYKHAAYLTLNLRCCWQSHQICAEKSAAVHCSFGWILHTCSSWTRSTSGIVS